MKSGLRLGGKTLWVVSTSVMLVGISYALALADEAQQIEAEKEMRMQQSANEVGFPFLSNSSIHPIYPIYPVRLLIRSFIH